MDTNLTHPAQDYAAAMSVAPKGLGCRPPPVDLYAEVARRGSLYFGDMGSARVVVERGVSGLFGARVVHVLDDTRACAVPVEHATDVVALAALDRVLAGHLAHRQTEPPPALEAP